MDLEELITGLKSGEPRALARVLTLVDNRAPESRQILSRLFTEPGAERRAKMVGITGPPGVGKSTLADGLASLARARDERVAILAIDPTSPFTGGAILGDRARMDAASKDPGVFVRSMATRGHVGGLSGAAFEALVLLEASGRDYILVETVGAGQDEVEVAAAVDVTVVVLAPGLGDELQAAKAGLIEIADILVVNKADWEGAGLVAEELRAHAGDKPVLETVALDGKGLEPLYDAIAGMEGERRLMESWLRNVVRERLFERLPDAAWREAVDAVEARQASPYEAADRLLKALS